MITKYQPEEEEEEGFVEMSERGAAVNASSSRVRFSLLQTPSNIDNSGGGNDSDMLELTEPFLVQSSPPPPQTSTSSTSLQKRTNKLIAIWNESNLDKAIMRSEAVAFISNKPHETNFAQQKLLAWKPMLTPKFVVNLFLVCSILFIPIGVILYFTSMNIYEFKFDYTDCVDTRNEEMTCHEQLMKDIGYRCQCRIGFYEDSFQDETLNVYYMLENYFQNIRRYARSVDPYQLLGRRSGDESGGDDLAVECEPYRYYYVDESRSRAARRKYAPCGAIANSFFNDTFTMHYLVRKTNETIKLNISKQNIAWDTDRRFKFMNPTDLNFGTTNIRPPNWSKNITELDSCYQNEDLMVWMRTAAFPSFRKLYGRVLLSENQLLAYKIAEKASNKTNSLRDLLYRFLNKSDLLTPSGGVNNSSTAAATLAALATSSTSPTVKLRFPKGAYYVDIDYNYPVKQFNGRKFFILANTSWLGGKCYFMAWAYIIVGVLCFFTSIILFFLHLYYGNMHYNTAVLLKDKTSGDVLEDSPPFR